VSNPLMSLSGRIVFFFPYRGIGGVSLLFLRMAAALRRAKPECQVALVDYPDGYMARNLADPDIEFIALTPDNSIKLKDSDTLVIQSIPLWRLPDELELAASTKILMWHLHPLNILSPSRRPDINRQTCLGTLSAFLRDLLYFGQFRQCRKLLAKAHENHGLIFMDRENFDIACQLNDVQLKDPKFVPVPSLEPRGKWARLAEYEDGLHVGWVGRLEDFKLPILFHTVDRLERICRETGRLMMFHIAGDGPGLAILKTREKQLRERGSSLKLRLDGVVAAEELDRWLCERVQILFAMGTAALDGAKNSIPTVLLDFSYAQINDDYVYRFLTESEGYTLGRLIKMEQLRPGNDSLEQILKSVETNPTEMGHAARSYFEINHSLDKVTEKFQAALDDCEFTGAKAKPFRNSDFVLSAYIFLRKLIGLSSFRITCQ